MSQPQQPPYQQYAPAGQPYGSAPRRPTNGLAIVSLVASLVGVTIVPFIGSIVGVVTGHMARRQITETGEEGAGLATAGLVIGYVGVGLIVAIVLIMLVTFGIFAAALSTSTAY